MEDRIRVTVLATGLGTARVVARQPVIQMVKTGTDNVGMEVNYGEMNLDMPAVMRRNTRNTVEAMSANGFGTYDIPAFLRKQAD